MFLLLIPEFLGDDLVLTDVVCSGLRAVELPTRLTVGVCCWFPDYLGSHLSHVELCYTGSIQLKRLTPHSTACFSAPDSVVLRYSRTRRQRGPPAKWRRKGTRDHAQWSTLGFHPNKNVSRVTWQRCAHQSQSRLHVLAALARCNVCPWFTSWVRPDNTTQTHRGTNSKIVHYFGRRDRDSYSLCRSKDAIAIQIIGNAPDHTTDTVSGHSCLHAPR